MSRLEEQLRGLLRRKEPPEGFADRVMARLDIEPARRSDPTRRRATLGWARWVIAAAACLLLVFGFMAHRRDQRRRAETAIATEQASVGLNIARAQLNLALAEARQAVEQNFR